YRKSLELNAGFVEALNNLGVLLEGKGLADEAIDLLQRAVELKRAPDLLNNLGVAQATKREFHAAIESYLAALEIDPHYAAAWNNLGNAQRSIGETGNAVVSLRKALRLRPDYAEAYNNFAIALVQSGRHVEAMRYYNLALHFRPDYPEAHMNRSLDRLALSDFEAGWIEYEWRWRGKQLRPRYPDSLRWDGSSPASKRLLIHFEQGLGDTIQFIRYAQELKRMGAVVIAEIQPPLMTLLQESGCGVDELVAVGDPLPQFDFHAPLLSLPGLLNTSLGTIPAKVPYLSPRKLLVERWKSRLSNIEGYKIGIAWQGNPEYRGDRHRSIPLKSFAAIAQIPGVVLISLQKGHGTEQLTQVAEQFDIVQFEDLDDESGPFMDTAAIMRCLDLVVTSDTALPHLAGSLGVPVWVALPVACDWRWMHGREDSPWYPTMRLFRQTEPDDWVSVFRKISDALPQRMIESRQRISSVKEHDRAGAAERWRKAVDLIKLNQLSSAEEALVEALHFDSRNAILHHDLGVVRGKQGRPDKAAISFQQSLELDPNSASTWGNLGLAFLEQDKLEEAVAHLQRALSFGPNAAETFNNLGVTSMRLARPQTAATYYRQALRLRPDYAEAHLNLARSLLIQGQYEEGWLQYEWRWRCPGYETRDDEHQRWGGEPLGDRTILLCAEQGLGDTIQFARFAKVVKRSGGTVLMECQPPLAEILKSCHGIDLVIPRGRPVPHYDVHVPLMSLPGLLGVNRKTIPREVPYLQASEQLVRQWNDRLREIDGFRIGIAWQGNPKYEGDRNRSIELKRLAPLACLPNVRLINLQKGTGSEQLVCPDAGIEIIDFGDRIDENAGPFMDTAAIMNNLDLVVTTDSAVAHLAGALGVPVWLMIAFAPDFRWLLDREDSPWYPTMRIYRQSKRNHWDDVIDEVANDIRRIVVSRAM
ncbi:MAG: tetratricopeptide repeat protein, partial [Planctomycetales bacterium]|nr:tetratricopeptide repeat protein [Planctomycetales bacterium]